LDSDEQQDAYTIRIEEEVLSVVARFDTGDARYWNVSLVLIAKDPFERWGQYVERPVPILGLPSVTHNFWITQHSSAGGERTFVFTAEYFDWRPVYVVDEGAREVGIISVRERWVYDPM
jgi:hypothetical protein